MTTIETQVWVADPERPGMLKLERTKTVEEVYAELRAQVSEYPEGGEEYFTVTTDHRGGEWPQGRIAVYAVTGDSEGHYVHVDVIGGTGEPRQLLLLAKTFAGFEAAWYFAKKLATLLGA